MTARRSHLVVEILEQRRLLSFDAAAVATEAPDWERRAENPNETDLIASNAGADYLVVAPTRTPIYPPLAPAMWMDDSVGSFELPEAIAVAFFAPDAPSEEFLGDAEELKDVATEDPQPAEAPVAPRVEGLTLPSLTLSTASITELLFERDLRLSELDGIALA